MRRAHTPAIALLRTGLTDWPRSLAVVAVAVALGWGERILRGRPRFLAILGSSVTEDLGGRPRFLGAGGGGAAAGRAGGRTERNCWVSLTRLFAWPGAWVEGLAGGAGAAAEAERVALPRRAGGRVGAGASSARFRFFSAAGAATGGGVGGGGGGGGGDGAGEGVGSFFTTDMARVWRLAGGGAVAPVGFSTCRFRFFVGSSAAFGSEGARVVFSGPLGPTTSSPNRFGGFRVRCPRPPSTGASFMSMARLSVVGFAAAGLAFGSRFLGALGTVYPGSS